MRAVKMVDNSVIDSDTMSLRCTQLFNEEQHAQLIIYVSCELVLATKRDSRNLFQKLLFKDHVLRGSVSTVLTATG